MSTYTNEYHVGAGETDLFNLCRPSALLNFLQDTATTHAKMIGMDHAGMIQKHNGIWVLTRYWYQLDAPVFFEDALQITTWHRGHTGALAYRDFDILRKGERIGKAVSAWVIADVNTRRVVRLDGLAYPDNGFSGWDVQLKKITLPEGMQDAGVFDVHYSHLDINAHMNHVRYADVCTDAVSFETMSGQYVRELQINYLAECLAGQRIRLSAATDANEAWVAGVSEEGTAKFHGMLRFAQV